MRAHPTGNLGAKYVCQAIPTFLHMCTIVDEQYTCYKTVKIKKIMSELLVPVGRRLLLLPTHGVPMPCF
jgi:hypothetical protein